MSAIDHLHITLEHDIDEHYQYQPGEIVRGIINVTVVRPTFIQSIFISIKGEGNVTWGEENGKENYQVTETYIDAAKVVVNALPGMPLNLNKGTEEFPFEYQLPENLPSSYIGKYGSVTYILKATVQGEKSIDTHITSEPFLVLRQSPLPSSVNNAHEMYTSKRYFNVCSFGKITAKCRLDRQGGVPGEELLITAEVQNRSGRKVTSMHAAIIMKSTYTAKNKKTNFQQIVNRKRDEFDLNYKEGRRWNFVRLTIPPYIPESKLEYCDIIDIAYLFQFRVELGGGGELTLECPLFIGSSPEGLEVPKVQRANRSSNLDWASRGMQAGDQLNHLYADDDDHAGEWNRMPPEMRSTDAVITNPLYRNESMVKPGSRYIKGAHRTTENPPEVIENTRL